MQAGAAPRWFGVPAAPWFRGALLMRGWPFDCRRLRALVNAASPRPLDPVVVGSLRTFAAEIGARFGEGEGMSWFGSFWDFVVTERPRLQRAEAAFVTGYESADMPWYILYWAPMDGGEPRIDLFVEAKDKNYSVAPWPVTSISLPTGTTVSAGTTNRPGNDAAKAALVELGFSVNLGYWGTHAHCALPATLDPTVLGQAVRLAVGVHETEPTGERPA